MQDTTQRESTDLILPREFRMAPVLRRMPYYFWLIPLAVFFMKLSSDIFYKLEILPLFLFLSCFALPCVLITHFWRLRVDREGIARRRFLLGWDFFSWDDFHSGRIQAGTGTTSLQFINRAHRLGRRTLSLDFMKPSDARELQGLIEKHWTRPVPPLPETITMRPWLGFGLVSWQMSAHGLTYRTLRQWETFSWDDVQSVEIRRRTHKRRDFSLLKITLHDRKLRLTTGSSHGAVIRHWTGAQADQVSAKVLKYVPPDKIKVLAMAGPPKSAEDIQYRIRRHKADLKGIVIIFGIIALLLAGYLIYHFLRLYHRGWDFTSAFILGALLFCTLAQFILPVAACLSLRKSIRKLEQWREGDAFDDQAS